MATDDERQRQFQAVLARMRRDYIAKFAEKAQELDEALSQYRSNPTTNQEQLRRLIHRLAGTAGSFGAAEVSERAAIIEQRFSNGVAPEELIGAIESLISTLRATADSTAAS